MTKIIQHLFCLLVWCQAVETLTELTHLGQNVSINCDLDEKEIYWMLLKLPNSPVMILRLFSTSPTPFYYDIRFRLKYSVQPKHHLFIQNVTTDELGVYYCMTTEAPPKFSNGTRLHITEPTKLPECQNHTVMKYIEQNHTVVNYTDQRPWVIVIIVSGLMHGVLVFVVIGYVCCYSRENLKHQEADLERTLRKQLKEPKTMVILQHCLEILLGFLMPYGLIISSYVCILRRLRKTRFRRHIRSENLILVIVITFGLTWLPFHTMNMVEIAGTFLPEDSHAKVRLQKIWLSFRGFSSTITFISSCINPVLYTFAGKSYIKRDGLAFMARLFEGSRIESMRKNRQNQKNQNQEKKEEVGHLKDRL